MTGKTIRPCGDPRLVLFARFPTAGACKTRLIPALGPHGAAHVHRRLTERTITVLRASGLPVTVAYTGASRAAFTEWLGDDLVLTEQVPGDLSDRLLACLDPTPVIFFGADTPDLQTHHVTAAITGLQSHDIVVGPAEDGGYYLIGMKTAIPALLTNMPWSTERVLPETLARCSTLGLSSLLLEPLADCDRPEDLVRWPHLSAPC